MLNHKMIIGSFYTLFYFNILRKKNMIDYAEKW
jgi:hypothetical protein